MTCNQIEELLSPYLDGELQTDKKLAVAEHLKTCPACTELLHVMSQAKQALADFPQKEFDADFMEQLYAIPHKKKKFRINLDFLLEPSLQPVFTGITIILTMISLYMFNPDRASINKSIERNIHLGYNKAGKLLAKVEFYSDSLNEYKDKFLVSVKDIQLLRKDED